MVRFIALDLQKGLRGGGSWQPKRRERHDAVADSCRGRGNARGRGRARPSLPAEAEPAADPVGEALGIEEGRGGGVDATGIGNLTVPPGPALDGQAPRGGKQTLVSRPGFETRPARAGPAGSRSPYEAEVTGEKGRFVTVFSMECEALVT